MNPPKERGWTLLEISLAILLVILSPFILALVAFPVAVLLGFHG